jgi:predicted phage terminase large subunit-like protein
LAAIAEDDESYTLDTELGPYSFARQRGEALHPERQPLPTLEQIRCTLGEYNFVGQHQQMPAPQGGGMVKAVWLRSYAPNERPDKFERTVQSWDTANKASELSDFSVCTTWGIKLKRAVREQCQAFEANVVLIEDKASDTQLIQELIQEGLRAVTRYQPQSDKIMRMHAQTAMIENGFVHLPKEAGWLAEYVHELQSFPRGKHDDQVDSTAQMLDWFKQAGREPQDWMWQQYKQAQARGPEPARPEPLSVMAKRLGILRPL